MPTRGDLARWILHVARHKVPLTGASDHAVSEAFYLDDPEGNGVEVYCDRPEETWEWAGRDLKITTDPLDVDSILREVAPTTTYPGAPDGLRKHSAVQITERALDLYESMGKLKCSCLSPRPPTQGPCPGCAKWYDLHDLLDDELHLPPWYWPIVGRQGARAAGSPAMNETIAATMKMFEDAIRRRRAAAATAREEEEGADAEPAGDTFT